MNILAFGEIMIRLMPPDYKLLSQTDTLEYMFCGTGMNILSGLYRMGNKVYIATRLPDNRVGYAAAAQIRKLGIDDTNICYGDEHMGIYFLEKGIGCRAAKVTYMNRTESSFGKSTVDNYNIDSMLKGIDCVHLCGISLALNENTRQCVFKIAKEAKNRNIKVIFDCNFRKSLWKSADSAKQEYEKILKIADIVFAGEKDAELILQIENKHNLTGIKKTEYMLKSMMEIYNIDTIFGTIRYNNMYRGYMVDKIGMELSKEYEITVYDRVGAGDGFAAGAIHSIFSNMDRLKAVEFATCSGVLAHTVYGDCPVVDIEDIQMLMDGKSTDLIR